MIVRDYYTIVQFHIDSPLESLQKHDNNWKGKFWEVAQFYQ